MCTHFILCVHIVRLRYQAFMAEVWVPTIKPSNVSGVWFDTLDAQPPGAASSAPTFEFGDDSQDGWLYATQSLMAAVKRASPELLIFGNNWPAEPMVIDGSYSTEFVSPLRRLQSVCSFTTAKPIPGISYPSNQPSLNKMG